MRSLGVAAVLAAAACGGDRVTVIEPPELDRSVRALILAIDTGETFEVHAIDVKDGVAAADAFPIKLPKKVPENGRVVIEALSYTDTLGALGLRAGPLAPATTRFTRALRSAPKAVRLDLDVAKPDVQAWGPIETLSAKLTAFRYDGPANDCAEFDVTIGNLGSAMTSPVLGDVVAPGIALIGTVSDAFFTVRVGEVAQVSTRVPQVYLAMSSAGNDTLWFGGEFGLFARGHYRPELGIDASYYTPSNGQIRWVAAGPVELGTDVFLLSWQGVLEHFDGTSPTARVVHNIGAPSGEEDSGDLAWVGHDEAIVAWPAVDRAVLRAKRVDGQWVTRAEPTDASAAFISAGFNPQFGAVVGNSNGQFYRDTGNGWREVPNSPLHVWAFSVEGYEDGFVYGSAFGNLGQYTPSSGYCPLQQITANDVRHIVVVGRDLVLFGPSQRQASYAWLHRR